MSAELIALSCDPRARATISQLHEPLRSVAIVGAREADCYGRALAQELARVSAESGPLVISGGARGGSGRWMNKD